MSDLFFLSGWIISALFAAWFIRRFIAAEPISGVERRRIFRYVRREDRAAYVRIMRRTMAVQMRDLNRQFVILGRTIGKIVLPSIQRFADALNAAFGSKS